MLNVHSIETFGTQDGPGIRLVVFVQGCNFRCVYCHNPDTQDMTNSATKPMTSEEIIELLERQREYFGENGGLTVSGGEPTMQVEAVTELFTLAKARGFNTCLDTNGSIFNDKVKQLYQVTDLVMLDVKHIDSSWHQKLTGQSNEVILQCARYRESTGKPMWLRYVLVPGWTDQEEYIEAWAKHFSAYTTIAKIEILPYHSLGAFKYEALGRLYSLRDVEPPTMASINRSRDTMAKYLSAPISV